MLLFVYNAESGKLNAALDMAHKWLHPQSYRCSLCQLTHGVLSEKRSWQEFRKRSKIDLVFLHRNEFERDYPNQQQSYPVVLRGEGGEFSVEISAAELDACTSVEELIGLLQPVCA